VSSFQLNDVGFGVTANVVGRENRVVQGIGESLENIAAIHCCTKLNLKSF
jgi:hypothetical protein